jgi:hypothetical protein
MPAAETSTINRLKYKSPFFKFVNDIISPGVIDSQSKAVYSQLHPKPGAQQ